MQFEYIEKHIFSGILYYFRLFLTDALTSLVIVNKVLKVELKINTTIQRSNKEKRKSE